MSDTDPDDRSAANLHYATEKIVATVMELADSETTPLSDRLRLAWIDQGQQSYPPGDDIPENLAAAIRNINAQLTDDWGQALAPDSSAASSIARRLVLLACGLNATLAVSGDLYYGQHDV